MEHCTTGPSGIETVAGVTWLVVDDCRISYLNKAETKEVSIEVNMHVSSVNRRSTCTCATSRDSFCNFIGNDTAAAIQQSLSYPPLFNAFRATTVEKSLSVGKETNKCPSHTYVVMT